jgi:probable HAF family extracellular repeat protein
MGLAINDQGYVVGASGSAAGPRRAVRWSRAAGMHDLGVLPGMDWSLARAISNNGVVVGSSGLNDSDVERAFVWTESHGMRDLGALPISDGKHSAAFGVNFTGKVVGFSSNGTTLSAVIFPTAR